MPIIWMMLGIKHEFQFVPFIFQFKNYLIGNHIGMDDAGHQT
jgi:hypothetical protein